MRICFLLIGACLMLGSSTKPGQTSSLPAAIVRKLDAELPQIVARSNLPSVAVGIWIHGRKAYSFVRGYADLPSRSPRNFEQPFRIASITKTFVATVVLALIDRSRLSKSDRIAKWFPKLPNAKLITVDDLLRMRSGIPAPDDAKVLEEAYDDPLMAGPSLRAQLAPIAAKPQEFTAPNRKSVYSNLNYMMLTEIAERAAGQHFETLLERYVVGPLNLQATSYPSSPALPGGLHGYGWNDKTRRFEDKTLFNPAIAGGAGAMISSMEDLQKYAKALCAGGLLNPQTQRVRLQGAPINGGPTQYGEGVAFGHGLCGHSGTIPGFNTDMYYLPKLDLALVVSVNRLDRDDKAQTTPVTRLVETTLESQLGSFSR